MAGAKETKGGLFGRIALAKGFVTEEELRRGLRAQDELSAFGLTKPLGAVLKACGILDETRVQRILRLQALNDRRRLARRVARLASKNGLIEEPALKAALSAARRERYRTPLPDLLLARGDVDRRGALALERVLERRERSQKLRVAATERFDPKELALESGPDDARDLELDDVAFAAVALRDGFAILPELERALADVRALGSDRPELASILVERGILSPRQVEEIRRAIAEARATRLRIPGYTPLDLLGQGSTSLVLRARHDLLGREVAIKVLQRQTEQAVEEFVQEARLTASLRHPNVVFLYEVGRLPKRAYLVMELVEGSTLMEEIRRRGQLPIAEALSHGRDLCRALEALIEKGLVHRDVKPHNVVLAKDGSAKLADLGLARRSGWSADREGGSIAGTPHTMSPELAEGRPIDARSDLYSLGATLFYALAGCPPYHAETALKIVMCHLHDPVPDPRRYRPELDERAARLVMRLLAKNPGDRPSGPGEVAEELERLLARS